MLAMSNHQKLFSKLDVTLMQQEENLELTRKNEKHIRNKQQNRRSTPKHDISTPHELKYQ